MSYGGVGILAIGLIAFLWLLAEAMEWQEWRAEQREAEEHPRRRYDDGDDDPFGGSR